MNTNPIYSVSLPINIEHINYGSHLGYDSLLSILHEARMRWLKEINPKITEINMQDDIGWIVSKLNVSYKSEGSHGDNLTIDFSVKNQTKLGFILEHTVTNETT